MQNSEFEDTLLGLRQQINKAKMELSELGNPLPASPELITSANLLRKNEYLAKANEKKSKLLELYIQYSSSLESVMTDIIKIQKELATSLKKKARSVPRRQPKKKKITKKKKPIRSRKKKIKKKTKPKRKVSKLRKPSRKKPRKTIQTKSRKKIQKNLKGERRQEDKLKTRKYSLHLQQ